MHTKTDVTPSGRGRGRPAAEVEAAEVEEHKFWTELLLLIELVQPFSDALHLLEGDRPLLPQVVPIWEALEQHVDAFVAKYPDEKFKSLPEMFKRRRDKHCPDAAYASLALDPASFTKDEASGDWQTAIMTMDSDEVARVEKHCERFVAPDEIDALRDELAMLQLEPLPKKLESLYKVCSRRTETVDGARTKVVLASGSSRRGLWTNHLSKNGFPLLALCADRLLSMHATSAATERNWSVWGQIYTKYKTCLGLVKGSKIVYVRCNSKFVDEDDNEIAEIYLDTV
jgi:hypothetical protein